MKITLYSLGFTLFFSAMALAQQPPPAAASPATDAAYRVQVGDVLDVRFFYHPEVNEQGVQVRPDGKISMQLIGEVQFAGLTVEEISRFIENAFSSTLRVPKVSIQIRSYSTQKAYVAGQVLRPGTIPLNSSVSVLSALGEAGGILPRGNDKKIILIRKMPDGSPARRELILFNGKQPTQDAMLSLQPYDVLLVPESRIARMDRWVDQYIRQLSPVNLSAGFTYLWQNNPAGGGVVAPF